MSILSDLTPQVQPRIRVLQGDPNFELEEVVRTPRIRRRGGWGKPNILGNTDTGAVFYYTTGVHAEYCKDEIHKKVKPFGLWQTGGKLDLRRDEYFHIPSASYHLEGIGSPTRTYDGRFVPQKWSSWTPAGSMPTLWEWSGADLSAHTAAGAAGFKKYKPGKGFDFNAGQFVGELAQIPRGIGVQMLQSAQKFRSLGSEYLNVQFGWKPFLNDLQNSIRALSELERKLQQLRRDNGQSVRRHGLVKRDVSWVIGTESDSLTPILTSEFYPAASTNGVMTRTRKQTWEHKFSARFRYWIPDIESPSWRKRATKSLLGANVTPSLVWELTPWSWLSDWFLNLGTILDNLSKDASENLVAEYAYNTMIMTYQDICTVTRQVQSVRPALVIHDVSTSVIRQARGILRDAANPYGFGVTNASLSTKQWMILGALGLSRTRWN